jgi:hypothetical protein
VATDDSYLDPTNLNGKVQKHQNFEQELNANKLRIDEVLESGEELKRLVMCSPRGLRSNWTRSRSCGRIC